MCCHPVRTVHFVDFVVVGFNMTIHFVFEFDDNYFNSTVPKSSESEKNVRPSKQNKNFRRICFRRGRRWGRGRGDGAEEGC